MSWPFNQFTTIRSVAAKFVCAATGKMCVRNSLHTALSVGTPPAPRQSFPLYALMIELKPSVWKESSKLNAQ